MMDTGMGIRKEIEHLQRLIEETEAIMDQLPHHLQPYQELTLNLHREAIAKLEKMLAHCVTRVKG